MMIDSPAWCECQWRKCNEIIQMIHSVTLGARDSRLNALSVNCFRFQWKNYDFNFNLGKLRHKLQLISKLFWQSAKDNLIPRWFYCSTFCWYEECSSFAFKCRMQFNVLYKSKLWSMRMWLNQMILCSNTCTASFKLVRFHKKMWTITLCYSQLTISHPQNAMPMSKRFSNYLY